MSSSIITECNGKQQITISSRTKLIKGIIFDMSSLKKPTKPWFMTFVLQLFLLIIFCSIEQKVN